MPESKPDGHQSISTPSESRAGSSVEENANNRNQNPVNHHEEGVTLERKPTVGRFSPENTGLSFLSSLPLCKIDEREQNRRREKTTEHVDKTSYHYELWPDK
ncbi:Uncharacterized protein Rs2_30950 [Raphanus sativus]|nr:Uncharacterized protein Rs2_30950 [Raphanus sativus]